MEFIGRIQAIAHRMEDKAEEWALGRAETMEAAKTQEAGTSGRSGGPSRVSPSGDTNCHLMVTPDRHSQLSSALVFRWPEVSSEWPTSRSTETRVSLSTVIAGLLAMGGTVYLQWKIRVLLPNRHHQLVSTLMGQQTLSRPTANSVHSATDTP